jgi:hypothetical protein
VLDTVGLDVWVGDADWVADGETVTDAVVVSLRLPLGVALSLSESDTDTDSLGDRVTEGDIRLIVHDGVVESVADRDVVEEVL